MTKTINQCIDALKTLMDDTLVVPGHANGGYDYRTNPDKFSRSYMLHFWSGMPSHRLAAGAAAWYDVTIVLFAQHDKTPADQRTAERDLNTMENAIYDAIENDNSSEWLNITIVYPSLRPRAANEMPETRIAEIPIRLNLR